MPITRSRMLTMIAACNAYMDAFETMGHAIADVQVGRSDLSKAAKAWSDLRTTLTLRWLETIAKEEAHFHAWGNRLEREEIRQRHKRQQASKSPHFRDPNNPTLEDHERDVAEFLALEEALKNQTKPE